MSLGVWSRRSGRLPCLMLWHIWVIGTVLFYYYNPTILYTFLRRRGGRKWAVLQHRRCRGYLYYCSFLIASVCWTAYTTLYHHLCILLDWSVFGVFPPVEAICNFGLVLVRYASTLLTSLHTSTLVRYLYLYTKLYLFLLIHLRCFSIAGRSIL